LSTEISWKVIFAVFHQQNISNTQITYQYSKTHVIPHRLAFISVKNQRWRWCE